MVIRDFNAFFMLQKRRAEGLHKLHRLMPLGKLWSLAIFKILDLRVIHLHGIIRDQEANTKIRLDRGVANEAWIGKFPLSRVVHLSTHASNHLPLLLQVQSFDHQRQRNEKNFKFEESWLLRTMIGDN